MLFEERNGGLLFLAPGEALRNELDKKKHWWPRGIRETSNVWEKKRFNHSSDCRVQKATPERVQTMAAKNCKNCTLKTMLKFGVSWWS